MFNVKKKKETCTPGYFLCMRNLWLSPGLRGKRRKTMKKIRTGADTGELRVLILPEEKGQPEIVKANYLIQSWYREHRIRIVGLAESGEEANLMILRMMQECWNRCGNADLRAFLEQRIAEEGLEE